MFERLATVRLKTAEDAFDDGRIDEAFDIVTVPDLAGHRRTQVLLNKLAEALLTRGQNHLLNQRFTEALADFDRAGRCGHANEKVVEWRNRAVAASREAVAGRQSREAALAEAQARLAAGSLSGAQSALEAVKGVDAGRIQMQNAIVRQSDRAAEALEDAEEALKRDDLPTAVARLKAAIQLHCKMDGVADLEARLVSRVVREAMEAFRQGRLQRAEQQMTLLSDIGRDRPERVEAQNALQLARDAGKAVGDSRYAAAGVMLGRLAQADHMADWVVATRDQLNQLDDLRRSVLEGPLACFISRDAHRAVDPVHEHSMTLAPAQRPAAPPVLRAISHPSPDQGHRRLMLRIDGVGSFLLLNSQRVSIGRAGAGATADLQLVSDLADRQAEIIRSGEDYFVAASGGVELAGRPVEHALLQSGDKVRLGHRVRLRFLRPSRKSAAAVLELGEGVRMASDCRRAILMGGPIIISPRRDSHIVTPPGSGDYVLMLRDGAVMLKSTGSSGGATALALGAPLNVGDLRIGVQPVADGSSVGRVVG